MGRGEEERARKRGRFEQMRKYKFYVPVRYGNHIAKSSDDNWINLNLPTVVLPIVFNVNKDKGKALILDRSLSFSK